MILLHLLLLWLCLMELSGGILPRRRIVWSICPPLLLQQLNFIWGDIWQMYLLVQRVLVLLLHLTWCCCCTPIIFTVLHSRVEAWWCIFVRRLRQLLFLYYSVTICIKTRLHPVHIIVIIVNARLILPGRLGPIFYITLVPYCRILDGHGFKTGNLMFFKLMPLDEDVGEVVGTVHKQVTRLFCPLATIKQVPL